MIALAEGSNGRLIIPTSVKVASGAAPSEIAAVAGANLLTHGPEVCNWLCSVCPGNTLTVGAYAYMDGTLFVRVALAMDAIAMGVCKARPDARLAYLCSPTDCFTAPISAADQGDATYDRLITAAYASPIRTLSGGKFFQKNGFRYVHTDRVLFARGLPLYEACIVLIFRSIYISTIPTRSTLLLLPSNRHRCTNSIPSGPTDLPRRQASPSSLHLSL